MILALNEYPRNNTEHQWLEFSSDLQDEDWEQAQKQCNAVGQHYNNYLNRLCLDTVLPWLQETLDLEESVSVYPTLEALPSIWEFVNGTAINVGDARLVLIPSEANDIEELCVHQEWVDLPEFYGNYYLAIQVELEERWIRIWGYTTHQILKEEGSYDPLDQTYSLEREDLTEDIGLMAVALDLGLVEKASIPPLVKLSPGKAESLITQLGQPTTYSPRLDLSFEQWAVLFSNGEYRQRLYEKRCTKPEPALVRLGKWLQKETQVLKELAETGWLTLEEIFQETSVSPSLRFATRTDGVKRAKLIDVGARLGDCQVALLVALKPEADEKISILIQVRPAGGETYLPPDLKLILLSESGKSMREVTSRSRDNFIQLPEFKVLPYTQFSLQLAFDDKRLTEKFVASC